MPVEPLWRVCLTAVAPWLSPPGSEVLWRVEAGVNRVFRLATYGLLPARRQTHFYGTSTAGPLRRLPCKPGGPRPPRFQLAGRRRGHVLAGTCPGRDSRLVFPPRGWRSATVRSPSLPDFARIAGRRRRGGGALIRGAFGAVLWRRPAVSIPPALRDSRLADGYGRRIRVSVRRHRTRNREPLPPSGCAFRLSVGEARVVARARRRRRIAEDRVAQFEHVHAQLVGPPGFRV